MAALAAAPTAPVVQPQPLTRAERESIYTRAAKAMDNDANLSWRDAIVTETERACGIGQEGGAA